MANDKYTLYRNYTSVSQIIYSVSGQSLEVPSGQFIDSKKVGRIPDKSEGFEPVELSVQILSSLPIIGGLVKAITGQQETVASKNAVAADRINNLEEPEVYESNPLDAQRYDPRYPEVNAGLAREANRKTSPPPLPPVIPKSPITQSEDGIQQRPKDHLVESKTIPPSWDIGNSTVEREVVPNIEETLDPNSEYAKALASLKKDPSGSQLGNLVPSESPQPAYPEIPEESSATLSGRQLQEKLEAEGQLETATQPPFVAVTVPEKNTPKENTSQDAQVSETGSSSQKFQIVKYPRRF